MTIRVDSLQIRIECPEHKVSSYWISGPLSWRNHCWQRYGCFLQSITAYVRRTFSGLSTRWMSTKSVWAQELLALLTFPETCVQTAFTWQPTSVSRMPFSTCRAMTCPVPLQMLGIIFLTIFSQVSLITALKTVTSWSDEFLYLVVLLNARYGFNVNYLMKRIHWCIISIVYLFGSVCVTWHAWSVNRLSATHILNNFGSLYNIAEVERRIFLHLCSVTRIFTKCMKDGKVKKWISLNC